MACVFWLAGRTAFTAAAAADFSAAVAAVNKGDASYCGFLNAFLNAFLNDLKPPKRPRSNRARGLRFAVGVGSSPSEDAKDEDEDAAPNGVNF